jgi:hypothetical protein
MKGMEAVELVDGWMIGCRESREAGGRSLIVGSIGREHIFARSFNHFLCSCFFLVLFLLATRFGRRDEGVMGFFVCFFFVYHSLLFGLLLLCSVSVLLHQLFSCFLLIFDSIFASVFFFREFQLFFFSGFL